MKRDDQDRLLDHEYDGIQEYDNPMPRWWLWVFYATIVYSVLYWFGVPGIGGGPGRIAAYEREVAAAEARQAKAAAAAGPVTEEALLAAAQDPGALEVGKTTYVTNCSPCHRADGGGAIGPNLTDDYWIHGGRPLEILRTVSEGVTEKGMPAWGPVLKPDQVAAVVAYLTTLEDSDPPDPKEPQGVKVEDEEPGSDD